jgi:hypothetical protein
MNRDLSGTTAPDLDAEDDDEPYWTDFVRPLVLLAIAVIPFTAWWDELADPDKRGNKYAVISRFLAAVGPVPIALTFGGLGLLLLGWEITRRRKRGTTASASIED